MLSRRAFAQGSLGALLAGCAAQSGAAEDMLLHGGPIYTGVADNPRVAALRMRGGRVVFAGALDEALSGPGRVRRIDLGGAAAYPGFTDAHVHLTYVGLLAMQLDLTGVESLAALKARLSAYAAAHPEGPIIGRGWIETHWPEQRFPNAADLDAVVSDRPVLLSRADGHAAVLNSAALTLAEIGPGTADPAGGRIERDASGRATGMLIDAAAEAAEGHFPAPTRAMKRAALAEASRLYASRGWTGMAEMGATLEEIALFEELAAAGEFPLRADLYATAADGAAMIARGPYASGRIAVRGVKLYMDGALGSRGAALLAPYSDAPGDGLLLTPIEEIRATLASARAGGAQIATHAIGDRGNRLVLDAYRDAFADDPAALRAARWRIEHAQIIAPADIARFGAMGVIASMQPSHCISDMFFAPARLGPDRLEGAYAWKSLLDTGAVVAAGSDAPVEKGDPLIEFYAAAYRHDLKGFAGPEWHLEEAVTRAQALHMLTAAPAFAVHEESARGVLAPGMAADVSVFSADLMEAEFADIPKASPVLTICEGAITHNAL